MNKQNAVVMIGLNDVVNIPEVRHITRVGFVDESSIGKDDLFFIYVYYKGFLEPVKISFKEDREKRDSEFHRLSKKLGLPD